MGAAVSKPAGRGLRPPAPHGAFLRGRASKRSRRARGSAVHLTNAPLAPTRSAGQLAPVSSFSRLVASSEDAHLPSTRSQLPPHGPPKAFGAPHAAQSCLQHPQQPCHESCTQALPREPGRETETTHRGKMIRLQSWRSSSQTPRVLQQQHG